METEAETDKINQLEGCEQGDSRAPTGNIISD